ncbi:spt5-like transcription initiation [Cryptosporidium bovis]|uniref:spt5-like transcription initiation n=1 Tax=Cryptosporidium bovis TaxID=310047 RepID=UPI00351A2550|nr:spt5-like transcription initiation [Cryptosporidium bovis]
MSNLEDDSLLSPKEETQIERINESSKTESREKVRTRVEDGEVYRFSEHEDKVNEVDDKFGGKERLDERTNDGGRIEGDEDEGNEGEDDEDGENEDDENEDDENEDDEGEDEEDDEDDEDEENNSPPMKKKRRNDFVLKKKKSSRKKKKRNYKGVNAFLDVEALVGEDDEEDEDDYYDDIYNEESEYSSSAAEIGTRRRADLEREDVRVRRHMGGAGHLEEAIAQLERKYENKDVDEFDETGRKTSNRDIAVESGGRYRGLEADENETDNMAYGGKYGSGRFGAMNMIEILPTTRDPKLWLVKLDKKGLERDLCISILQKSYECYKLKKELPILSAYAASNYRGYIYIEAEAPNYVAEALKGFRGVILSSIKIIPLKEMTKVFSADLLEKEQLTRESWVRVKSGLYKGDLAQVYEVDEHESEVIIRLVPRLDIQLMIRKSQNIRDETFSKSKIRPQARLFDRDKIESLGGIVELTHIRGTVKFANQLFEFEKGYLLKKMKSNRLIVGDLVHPSIDEIKNFFGASDLSGIKIDTITLLKNKKPTSFFVGDHVIITKGELLGVKSKVTSINTGIDESIEVLPLDKSLGITQPILIQPSHIIKSFEIGDSVRVIEGINEGESGLVTSFEKSNNIAIIYPLSGTQPIKCPINYLRKVSQDIVVSSGLSTVDGFSLDDLVQLHSGKIGVIVFVGRNKLLKVLTCSGECIQVKSSEISSKRNTSLMYRIPDGNGNIFGVKSTVQVIEGDNSGKSGKVEHIWKSTCFVKIPTKLDDNGYIVCECRQLIVIKTTEMSGQFSNSIKDPGSRRQNSELGGGDNSRGIGNNAGFGPASNGLNNYGNSRNMGGGGRVHGMGLHSTYSNRRNGPDDVFINEKVRIIKGKHKALIGSIRSFKGNNVEVLLDIGPHTVVLKREDILLINSSLNNSRNSNFTGQAQSGTLSHTTNYTGKRPSWAGSSEVSDNMSNKGNKSNSDDEFPPIFCRRGVEITVISQGEFYNKKGIISDILFPPEVPRITCYIILIIDGQIRPDEMIAISPQSVTPNKPSIGDNSISVSPKTGVFVGVVDSIQDNDFYIMDSSKQSNTKVSGEYVFKYHIPPE